MNILTELVLLAFIVTGPIMGLCGNKPCNKKEESKNPSHYNSQVRVDGIANEWPLESFFCNSATKVYYTAANDSSNVYLCVKVLNHGIQMSLLRNGFTIYLDPFGKKRKNCYLHLTFRPREFSGHSLENSGNQDPGDSLHPKQVFPGHGIPNHKVPVTEGFAANINRRMQWLFPIVVETNGFREGFNGVVVPGVQFQDFAACEVSDSAGTLIIEVLCPKKAFLIDYSNLKCISFGFEITGAMTTSLSGMPDGPDRRGQGGRMHGPVGGMNGGGPRGGMGGSITEGGMKGGGRNNEMNGGSPEMGGHEIPPSGMDEQSPKSVMIWYTFSMAGKP
jgi:hypothetical protein